MGVFANFFTWMLFQSVKGRIEFQSLFFQVDYIFSIFSQADLGNDASRGIEEDEEESEDEILQLTQRQHIYGNANEGKQTHVG